MNTDKKNTIPFISSYRLSQAPFRTITSVEKYFSKAECEYIVKYGENVSSIEALTVGDIATAVEVSKVRSGEVAFFNYADSNLLWLFEKLSYVVRQVNEDMFKFDLDYIQALQFTTYGKKGDQYGEHIDVLSGPPANTEYRKLSFSVQLSDSQSYTGGDLMVGPDDIRRGASASRTQGDIIFFPSFMNHKVTPIESGFRHSLVGWVCGPAFR
jgi:PKHD-type hydroxylase